MKSSTPITAIRSVNVNTMMAREHSNVMMMNVTMVLYAFRTRGASIFVQLQVVCVLYILKFLILAYVKCPIRFTGFSECTVTGDPEYTTFDKMKYAFEGEDLYMLVQTKNLPSNLPEFYIAVSNVCNRKNNERTKVKGDSQDIDDEDEQMRSKELKIKVYNVTVELKQKSEVFVSIAYSNTALLGYN